MDDGAAEVAETPAFSGSARNIRLYLVARFASQAAALSQAVAVGWYVYALTSSAFALGLIGLVQFLATAGLALVAGHALDRYSRRRVLLLAYAVEVATSAALAALALAGVSQIAPVFALIFCFGAARAFDSPALPSLLAALVPRDGFARTVAWSSLAGQMAVILGPTLGGLLYLLGPGVPFVAAAALLAVAFCCILALSLPRFVPTDQPLSWRGILSGLSFIMGNEAVCGAITLDLFGVLFGGATALLPIFARDVLFIGPAGLGLLRSAPALGGFAMGLLLARRPPQHHSGRRMLIAVAIFGVATIVFGLSRSLTLSFIALTIAGAADVTSVVIRMTLLQTAAPDAIRGRVNAVNSVFIGASNQLGEFESGATAAWLGPVASVVLGGAATVLIAAIWAKRFPALRRLDRFTSPESWGPMDKAAGGVSESPDQTEMEDRLC